MIQEGGDQFLQLYGEEGRRVVLEKKGQRFRLLSALIPSYLLQKAAEAITSTPQL